MDPTTLIIDFLFGSIGFVAFVYGRKMGRLPQILVGIGLIALTAVPVPWIATLAIGSLMVIALLVMVKLGV